MVSTCTKGWYDILPYSPSLSSWGWMEEHAITTYHSNIMRSWDWYHEIMRVDDPWCNPSAGIWAVVMICMNGMITISWYLAVCPLCIARGISSLLTYLLHAHEVWGRGHVVVRSSWSSHHIIRSSDHGAMSMGPSVCMWGRRYYHHYYYYERYTYTAM